MRKNCALYIPTPTDSFEPVPKKKPEKKILQVPVKIGWGEKQELVVVTSTVSPPSPPVFRVKDVDKTVVITQMKLVPINKFEECEEKADSFGNWDPWGSGWGWRTRAKVIINGYIDKNVNYKTITDFTPTDVNGPVFQFTTRAPFAALIDVQAKEPICETDIVELSSAIVEGEKEDLLDPNPVPEGAPSWAVTYNALLEKIIVKIKVEIKRIEEVKVQPDC